MDKPPSPIFDDAGTEVSRELYWGQTELGAELGTTPPYVAELLRMAGLLQREVKAPTAEALEAGAAIYVTVASKTGTYRYLRWRKDMVFEVLRHTLEENPQPETRSKEGKRDRSRRLAPPPSVDDRVESLERRVEELEYQLRLLTGRR